MISHVSGMNKAASVHSTTSAEVTKQSVLERTHIDEVKKSVELVDYIKGNPGYVPTVQEKTIINAIEKANQKLSGADREFEFSVHEKTKQIMVKIIDKETKEIVREIPSVKILDMVAKLCELNGLFVDEKR